jgi:hypothetical protein
MHNLVSVTVQVTITMKWESENWSQEMQCAQTIMNISRLMWPSVNQKPMNLTLPET